VVLGKTSPHLLLPNSLACLLASPRSYCRSARTSLVYVDLDVDFGVKNSKFQVNPRVLAQSSSRREKAKSVSLNLIIRPGTRWFFDALKEFARLFLFGRAIASIFSNFVIVKGRGNKS
jgi:hypothetical protein